MGDPILITGSTGFLGGRLARTLHRDGYRVLAMGRDATTLDALSAEGITTLRHDLSAKDVQTGPLDSVIHCAALSAPFGRRADFERANVAGTAAAIRLAKRANAGRFVLISTPSVYFKFADQLDVREDMPLPRPVNAYAATKQRAEKLVLAEPSLDPVILRPRGIYGPGDTALLPRLLSAAGAGPLPLLRDGAAEIDLTHVDDVVAAISAALALPPAPKERVFNISGGEVLPVRHIVEAACGLAGVTPRWRALPLTPLLWAAGAMETVAGLRSRPREPRVTRYGLGLFAYRQSLNLDRARSVLGWSPRIDFATGLDTVLAGKRS